MEFKNKLYRHHKSKLSLVVRNFSFAFIGFFTVACSIVIPTYISISSSLEIQTQAAEEKVNDNNEQNDADPNENIDQNQPEKNIDNND